MMPCLVPLHCPLRHCTLLDRGRVEQHRLLTTACAYVVVPFQSTGLERGSALARDIDWLCQTKDLEPLAFKVDGPGNTYVQRLQQLADEDIPAFMCHYYNVNFAHTAGGRMIGKAVADKILNGAELDFYKYDGDLDAIKNKVKENIEAVAQTWSEQDRKRSVEQTPDAFSYSGALLKCITQACDCDCPRREVPVSQEKELVAT